MAQVVRQQAGEPVEQLLRRVFPAVFRKLSRDQFNDFCELARVYRDEQDDEVLETMVEILVPESLGEVVMQALGRTKDASDQLDEYQRNIATAIRRQRMSQGWSQIQLAEKSGLKQTHISRLEKGVHTPTDLTIQKLADAFGIDPAVLDSGLA